MIRFLFSSPTENPAVFKAEQKKQRENGNEMKKALITRFQPLYLSHVPDEIGSTYVLRTLLGIRN